MRLPAIVVLFLLAPPAAAFDPTTDYTSFATGYVQEDISKATGSSGTYNYTFTAALPSNAAGTFAVGLEGRRVETVLAGTTKERSIQYGATNPVMYFEHKMLYRSLSGPVPEAYYTTPIGQAALAAEGDELSIITYGMGVRWALQTCQELGVSADILAISGNGRAFKRVRIVVSVAGTTPQVIYRRDLSDQGFPMDQRLLDSLRAGQGAGAWMA